jgi:hypothetical protein
MSYARRIALVVVAVLVLSAPAAEARLKGGELLGEAWFQVLSHPAGTFSGGCMPVTHKVVSPEVDLEGNASCTIRKGTTVMLFLGSECSDVEEPPFFGATAREQRECAIAADEFFVSAQVSIDGGDPIEQVDPRFEFISPQRTVDLPEDNFLGVEAQEATFVAHGWILLIQKLRPGDHVISGTVTDVEGTTSPFEIQLEVVRGGPR